MADAIPPAATPAAPPVVPPEVLQGIEAKVMESVTAKFQERLDGQSKVIASLEKQIKKQEPNKDTDPLTERVKALESTQKRVDEREAKQKEREVLAQIERGFIDAEVEPAQARRLAKLVYVEQQNNIAFDEENFVPMIKDGDKQVSIPAWLGAYLQTNDGKALLPARRNPTSSSLNGGRPVGMSNPGARRVTPEDLARGRVSPEDLKEGKVVVVGGASGYLAGF